MRVGVDATSVLDEGTGVENHVLTVVDALARYSDHELVAFVRRRPPDAWREHAGRLEVRALQTDSQVIATQVLLPRAAARAGLDVLYCGGKPPPAFYSGELLVGIHDAIPWAHPEFMGSRRAAVWFRTLYGRSVRGNCTVVTVSESSRRAIAVSLRIPPADIRVVGNALAPWFSGLDVEALPRPAFMPHGEYLLAVARLDPRRGVMTLLDAWDDIRTRRPDLNLVLAGKIGWKVNAAIERASRTPGVTMTGEVDHLSLAALYSHAAAFVTASVHEGFGLPVLEAMFFGAPVVATEIPPHVELASGAGSFFPAGDPRALAAAVSQVLEDQDARSRLIAAGQARALTFSAERLAAAFTSAAEPGGRKSRSRRRILN